MSSSPSPGTGSASDSVRFETLFEAPGLPRFELPDPIAEAYGAFGLPEDVRFANFVSTVDGVADIPELSISSPTISGGDPADRLVLGLLRAVADVVVIGAGTFRAHPGPWTAEKGYPAMGDAFADLRSRLELGPRPAQVVVSASGDVHGPPEKLRDTMVATTAAGAERLRGVSAPGFEVAEVEGDGGVAVDRVLALLAERGHRRILTEGGPRLMGQFLERGAVDELFLTVSPVIAGGGQGSNRPGFAAGTALLPDERLDARLLTARRSGSYLFLRYSLGTPTPTEGGSA